MINYADKIKSAVSMREVVEAYGFLVNRAGFMYCPFHGEKTASLKIYDGSLGWYCFGCQKGGDVIDFVRIYFNLSFKDACEKLNADFNLRLPIGEELTLRQKREADRKAAQRKRERIDRIIEHNRLLDAYEKALDRFCELDRMKIDNEPKNPSEPISEKFWYALKHMEEAKYELDEAEWNLRQFEMKQKHTLDNPTRRVVKYLISW